MHCPHLHQVMLPNPSEYHSSSELTLALLLLDWKVYMMCLRNVVEMPASLVFCVSGNAVQLTNPVMWSLSQKVSITRKSIII